ncbi:MAG: SDR family NAD(P)-dependent oxidoreductase [Acidimicrobiia bacterium]|nr:SDR family NAD(P)-dependent oxidoreductase [Acidimicrobiia bacterium]
MLPSRRAFVTGGTGLIGSHLVRSLVAEGWDVVALVRSEEGASMIHAAGALSVVGDVTGSDGLVEAMAGADIVFHVAGINETCPKDTAQMNDVNINGPVRVVEAAAQAGAARMVLTSSVVAIGEESGTVGTETTEHSGKHVSAYARSKYFGEVAARETSKQFGIDLVVVNPASVQGPGRSTGSAEILLRALRSHRPWLVDLTVSILDIADCSRGHILAAEWGVAGERYILSGATLSVRQAVSMVTPMLDRPINPRWIPPAVVRFLGIPLSWLVGGNKICPDLVRTVLHSHRYDNTKSITDLGMTYTPVEESFSRTIDWFRTEGLL